MTDKELSAFGESLYEAVLFTPLPAGTIFGLSLAIRQNIPWAQLPRHLKFAVFKIAASCTGETVATGSEDDAPAEAATAESRPRTDEADDGVPQPVDDEPTAPIPTDAPEDLKASAA